jgi:hypothetical protein
MRMKSYLISCEEGHKVEAEGLGLHIDAAKAAALKNVYGVFTDPTAAMLPPKGMLIPATLYKGKIMTGKLGTTHYDMLGVESRAIAKPGETAPAGFLDDAGNYMSRKDATEWLRTNQPEVYNRLGAHSRHNGLESQEYAHAARLKTEEQALMEEFMKQQFGQ